MSLRDVVELLAFCLLVICIGLAFVWVVFIKAPPEVAPLLLVMVWIGWLLSKLKGNKR
jgi:hypothetical protein